MNGQELKNCEVRLHHHARLDPAVAPAALVVAAAFGCCCSHRSAVPISLLFPYIFCDPIYLLLLSLLLFLFLQLLFHNMLLLLLFCCCFVQLLLLFLLLLNTIATAVSAADPVLAA